MKKLFSFPFITNIAQRAVFLLLTGLFLLSCSEDANDTPDNTKGYTITGSAQKGPFIKGSQITIFALNDQLDATGESYPALIADDLGKFEINSSVTANYVELRATGYYYDENTKALSDAPISLQSVISVKNKKANINLFTTLTYLRIKYLVSKGNAFENATRQAETELLKALNIEEKIDNSFIDMDISGTSKSDAMLLAISCLLQKERRTSELSAIISDIASDLKSDGELSQTLKEKVHLYESSIDVASIIKGMNQFYQDKEITQYAIPPFYKYLDINGNSTLDGKEKLFNIISASISMSDDSYSASGYNSYWDILSTETFSVSSDCDWIEVNKENTNCEGVYRVSYTLKANEGNYRTGHVLFKNATNEVIKEITLNQKSSYQRLYLKFNDGITTRSASLPNGDKISVNGHTLTIQYNASSDLYFVETTPQHSYAICYPADKVFPGQDLYSCKMNYPATSSGETCIPYYAALEEWNGMNIPNPARVELKVCAAKIRIEMSGEESLINAINSIELVGDEKAILSGTVDYLVYKDQSIFNPSYTPKEPIITSGSNKLILTKAQTSNTFEALIYPQQIQSLSFTVQGESYQWTLPFSEFSMGNMYSVKIRINDTSMNKQTNIVSDFNEINADTEIK